MGEKIDIYRSYGQKLISLFVRLLFSGESYSLTELSRMLDCSKQTVLRLLNDITMAYGVNIEESMRGNRKYVCIQRPDRIPATNSLTEMELSLLHMCRNFTAHLPGQEAVRRGHPGAMQEPGPFAGFTEACLRPFRRIPPRHHRLHAPLRSHLHAHPGHGREAHLPAPLQGHYGGPPEDLLHQTFKDFRPQGHDVPVGTSRTGAGQTIPGAGF